MKNSQRSILTLQQVLDTHVIVYNKTDETTYKPNLLKLLTEEENVVWLVEIHSYGKWFRIIRTKNYKRTHDFIINDFKTKEILLETNDSKYCRIQCSEDDIITMFKGKRMFVKFERRGDTYVADAKDTAETNIISLVEFWQRDLKLKSAERRNPISGDIFTDITSPTLGSPFSGKTFQIIKGAIPTEYGEYFYYVKKPERGAFMTAPGEQFARQDIDNRGLYPLELLRHEKVCLLKPLED
jgi:hypothetical protein